MSQSDYRRIEELYTTLSSIVNSGEDVLTDIKKEINNEELILLKDEIMPYLAKHIAASLQQLKCQLDVSIQYDGSGNLSYSFCKSGSKALIRGNIKNEDLIDFKIVNDFKNNNSILTEKLKSKKEILRVKYPDGRIIQYPKSTDTYIEVIENNYPELIHELNIIHSNVNIVTREYSDRYAFAQHEIANGWLVFTNTSTRKKRNDLIKISEELELGLRVDLVSVDTGEIIELDDRQSDSNRQKIKVSFPDGRVIQPNKVFEAVVEVVKYAGPERVKDLNIICCGDNLILKQPHPRYDKACKPVGDDWLVNTYSNTITKYEQITFISKQLNLGITAEIVYRDIVIYHNEDKSEAHQLVSNTIDKSAPLHPIDLQTTTQKEIFDCRLRIVDYSKRTFILYGDTTGYEKFIEEQYGVFYKQFPEGPGWLLPKDSEAVIRDFFKLTDNSYLEELLEQLSNMRTIKNKGIKSPHKAIYVMCIMKGIRDGRINYNRICIDDYLIQTFNELWVQHVPTNTPYTMEIGNPFIHLSAEPFYFLHLTAEIDNLNKGWSIGAINKVCDYAYVSNRFKQIVVSNENSRTITEHLIDIFGLKKSD